MQAFVDDEELVTQARQGRTAAFGALVARYRDRAWSTAHRLLRDPAAADDVTQDSFERAYRQLGSLQGRFWPWLSVIVRHAAVDHQRRRRPDEPNRDPEGLETGAIEGRSMPRLLDVVDQHRLRAQLYAALATLDEHHRAVLVLREIDGLSYAHMAQVLDIPEGTVMSRLSNARQKARSQLRDYRAARLVD